MLRLLVQARDSLASVKRRAWGKGDQEKSGGCDACEQNCQAAGEDMIVAHRSCLIVLANSPLCFVNGEMGTHVLDEHC